MNALKMGIIIVFLTVILCSVVKRTVKKWEREREGREIENGGT
jgi:hypothetical protein